MKWIKYIWCKLNGYLGFEKMKILNSNTYVGLTEHCDNAVSEINGSKYLYNLPDSLNDKHAEIRLLANTLSKAVERLKSLEQSANASMNYESYKIDKT